MNDCNEVQRLIYSDRRSLEGDCKRAYYEIDGVDYQVSVDQFVNGCYKCKYERICGLIDYYKQ